MPCVGVPHNILPRPISTQKIRSTIQNKRENKHLLKVFEDS